VLNRRYPTYGKLLREAGYQTPYIGKWHLSVPQVSPSNPEESLELYGFDGMTLPDPTGGNLQGTYGGGIPTYLGDGDVADQAATWLSGTTPNDQPWCLTVGFVNPHDKEFFPAGTEYETFSNLFADPNVNPNGLSQYLAYATEVPATYLNWADNALKSPPSYGYPAVPPNWESMATLTANKPSYQQVVRDFQALVWGGVSDDPNQTGFSVIPYPKNPLYPAIDAGIGVAPYSYWQRSMDSYTQIMAILDERIGQVLNAMPAEVAENTVVMFTSDHGDFAGAHGLVSGKSGTVYDEAIRVPLIVADGSGRFTGDVDAVRTGLTSAVDMLPLIVSLGHGGSDRWMRGDMRKLYETRHDMLPMLRSARAKGRKFALHTNDEIMTPQGNFLNAPNHVIGSVTRRGKLGLYSFWLGNSVQLDPMGYEMEYYDYATEGGRLEVDNTSESGQARKAEHMLRHDLIRHELRRPLPRRLRIAQEESKLATQAFFALVKNSVGGH